MNVELDVAPLWSFTTSEKSLGVGGLDLTQALKLGRVSGGRNKLRKHNLHPFLGP